MKAKQIHCSGKLKTFHLTGDRSLFRGKWEENPPCHCSQVNILIHGHPVQLLLGCSWTSLKSLQYYQSPKLGLLIDRQLHFTLQIVHIYFAFIFLCTQEKGRRWQSLCKLPGENMNWSWEKIDLTTDSWTLDGGWCVDDVHRCFPQVAETVLGWKSRRSLGEMCRDMWKWQTKNPQGFSGKQSEKVGAAAWSFHYSVT